MTGALNFPIDHNVSLILATVLAFQFSYCELSCFKINNYTASKWAILVHLTPVILQNLVLIVFPQYFFRLSTDSWDKYEVFSNFFIVITENKIYRRWKRVSDGSLFLWVNLTKTNPAHVLHSNQKTNIIFNINRL